MIIRKLWLKYQFWRRIIIANPIYVDGHGNYHDGPPLKGWKLWAIRVKLWFGIKLIDNVRINETASKPFTGEILDVRTWDRVLSPEEVQADYERHMNDDA